MSPASAFAVRARRMVAGLTTLVTLVVGAVGLFGTAPAAAQCGSCGPANWEDIPMGEQLTYYFPASRRGYFTGQMSVRYGTCCVGAASLQFPWGRWFSRPTSNCVSTTQQFSVTVSATQTSFDAGCPATPYCPNGCSCTAILGNPTNRRTFAWTWPGEPQPYDFIAGIVPAGPGETAARFVVTNKGECTTQTRIYGWYSLDGSVTKHLFDMTAPAGGTRELLLPIADGDACTQTCTLWYSVTEFLSN
ncbi:MAG: hypothetical protein ACKO3W_08475, partial [bacterium]